MKNKKTKNKKIMIIDSLSNAKKYSCVHPLFARAFEYIQSQNLETIESGKNEISGDELKAIVSNKPGKTVEESTEKFECHDKHIDIQLCIKGKERIGWKPRHTCTQLKEEYNAEKDVAFYKKERRAGYVFPINRRPFCYLLPGRCTYTDDRRRRDQKDGD